MAAENLRTSFLEYCHESGRSHLPDCQQIEARRDLVQRLNMLRLQCARCHSAYECAKTYSDAGPMLTTMARSQLVAYDSQLCQAVVGAAMEYSKVLCLGVYSNQRASLWFSHVVKSLLAISKQGDVSGYADVLQRYQINADEVAGGRFALQTVLRLFASEGLGGASDDEKRCLAWQKTLSLCSNSSHPDMLFGELLDGIDDCGWRVLETHELVERHGIRLLTGLPLPKALV
ncbi:hypothetical protein LPJ81_002376 [Coemansia sp. IMI 209127]|nr:hypothetical protein LPJ81_002376 [Coemansia sp. IMI 209127]